MSITAAFALLSALPVLAAAPASDPAADRVAEAQLAEQVNAYRRSLGLSAVSVSPALTKVAEAHAINFMLFGDGLDFGKDGRGMACNLHSWAAGGPWRPFCYTDDHRYSDSMWNKPREVTGGIYAGNGYEIAFWSGGTATAENALASWKSSPGHNAVITESGAFKDMHFQAMGVGVYGHVAFIWFGTEPDKDR